MIPYIDKDDPKIRKKIRHLAYNRRARDLKMGIDLPPDFQGAEIAFFEKLQAKADKLAQELQTRQEMALQRITEIPEVEESIDFRKEWLDDPERVITTEYMRNVPVEIVEREYMRTIAEEDTEENQDRMKQVYDLLKRLDLLDNRSTKRKFKVYWEVKGAHSEYTYL